jgi:hypothetical protein
MKRLTLLCLAIIAAPAMAVSTSYWTQSSEADFKSGTLNSVVATSLGELKLSRAVNVLLDEDPRISTVNKLIEAPDGTIYAGTGPSAVLLQIKDQKVTTVATIPDATDILSMTFDKSGALLLGTGGENGKVLRIDKPGARNLFRGRRAIHLATHHDPRWKRLRRHRPHRQTLPNQA